jgi:cell division protein FtsL
LQDLNSKIGDEEAEIERLKAQIGELSRKIEKEPETNDLDKVIADAKGTALHLRLIKVVINKDVESVMYTI